MTTEQIQYLPLERITPDQQIRRLFAEDALLGLAQSMKEVGQQQPIRVRRDGDKFIIVDGERRYRAAKKAGFMTLAVIMEEKPLCPAEVIHRQLISACQREDLTAMEKARAIGQLLKETGWSATQAAAKLGLSNAGVSRLLALLSLPGPVVEQVESGAIPVSAAYELAHVDDEAKQADLAGQVAAGNLTRDSLSGTLKKERRSIGSPSSTGQPARVTAVLGNGRSVTICGPGLTLESFINWMEELLAKARKVRPQGLELPTFIKMLRDQAKTS